MENCIWTAQKQWMKLLNRKPEIRRMCPVSPEELYAESAPWWADCAEKIVSKLVGLVDTNRVWVSLSCIPAWGIFFKGWDFLCSELGELAGVSPLLLRGPSGYMKEYLHPLNSEAIVLSLQKPQVYPELMIQFQVEKSRLCKKSQCGSFLYLSVKCDKSQDSPRNRYTIGSWTRSTFPGAEIAQGLHCKWSRWFPNNHPPAPATFFFNFFLAALCGIWNLLVSWAGIGPVPPAVESWGLNHRATRKSSNSVYLVTWAL